MDNNALSYGGSICFASGALGNGTTAATIKTTVAIPYTIDGAFQTAKAITDNIVITLALPAVYGDAGTGAFTGQTGGSTRLYGIMLDTAGAVTLVPGPIVNTASLAAGSAALHFPPSVRNKACCGVMRVAVTGGTAFVPGVTALNAAGVTTSFVNLSGLPGEPLRA